MHWFSVSSLQIGGESLRILSAPTDKRQQDWSQHFVGRTSRTKCFRTDVNIKFFLVLLSQTHSRHLSRHLRYTLYTFMHIKPKYENLKMSVYNQSQALFPFGICVILLKIFGRCDCEIFHARYPTACSTLKDKLRHNWRYRPWQPLVLHLTSAIAYHKEDWGKPPQLRKWSELVCSMKHGAQTSSVILRHTWLAILEIILQPRF